MVEEAGAMVKARRRHLLGLPDGGGMGVGEEAMFSSEMEEWEQGWV